MKIEVSKEWCGRRAQFEGDAEIGAGLLAADPVFDVDPGSDEESRTEAPNVAFERFVRSILTYPEPENSDG